MPEVSHLLKGDGMLMQSLAVKICGEVCLGEQALDQGQGRVQRAKLDVVELLGTLIGHIRRSPSKLGLTVRERLPNPRFQRSWTGILHLLSMQLHSEMHVLRVRTVLPVCCFSVVVAVVVGKELVLTADFTEVHHDDAEGFTM
jgi:hypothetical protein